VIFKETLGVALNTVVYLNSGSLSLEHTHL
jgi:hypothetical protein